MIISLITGSTGFIGQRLTNALDGKVRVLSRENQIKFDTIICDLCVDDIPKHAFKDVKVVYHLAGYSHDMQKTSKISHHYSSLNIDATVKLAKLSVKYGVKKFIFISSVKAGGVPKSGISSTELDQGIPEDIYGFTKRKAELELLKIGNNSNMDIVIIRPALVYGPGVKGNLKTMLGGIEKGWFPPLPKSSKKRSMIHVDDLVRAILFVNKNVSFSNEIFIAAENNFYSSREIYIAMCHMLGREIPKWTLPNFFFDFIGLLSPSIKYKVNKLLGDESYSSSKLQKLGFETKKTLKDFNETDF